MTIEKTFCGMPHVVHYFQTTERRIKKFKTMEGREEEAEQLKKEKQRLFNRAKEIDKLDLEILYYIHKLASISPLKIKCSLERMYEAQQELIETLEIKNPF